MVRRIRKMLSLKAQSEAALINFAILAGDGPVQKIAGIELHTGLVGEHLQHTSSGWLINFCRRGELSAAAVEHPIVIVALPLLQLIVEIGRASCRERV